MSGGARAILESLGLDRRDAGVVLGAFLAAPREDARAQTPRPSPLDAEDSEASPLRDLDETIFAHLEAAWAVRCREAILRIRALAAPERASILRALSSTLVASPEETWRDLEATHREKLVTLLDARLRELHPQSAAAIVMSLPSSLGHLLARHASAPCRLPKTLRQRIVQDELARMRDACRDDGDTRDRRNEDATSGGTPP